MNLSKQQLAAFWRIFPQAAKEAGGDATAYRRRILLEEAGVEHLGELDRTVGFDRVMSRLASEAGDYALAVKYSGGGTERYRHLIIERAREIVEGGITTPEKYVAGIMFQGRMIYRPHLTVESLGERLARGEEWDSMPVETLRLVLQIVTSEWRKVRAGK